MADSRERLWIMVDIETSGPIYGHHSMTELGAVVGSEATGEIARFESFISPISEHVIQSRTSFDRASREGQSPVDVMKRFATWARPFQQRRATFVARPAAFDWPWIVFYAWKFLGENPFGFKAVCASSWFEARDAKFQVTLPHVAVEDASIQLTHFLSFAREPSGQRFVL